MKPHKIEGKAKGGRGQHTIFPEMGGTKIKKVVRVGWLKRNASSLFVLVLGSNGGELPPPLNPNAFLIVLSPFPNTPKQFFETGPFPRLTTK